MTPFMLLRVKRMWELEEASSILQITVVDAIKRKNVFRPQMTA